jgi:inner membrane transporter RhtA
MVVGAVASVQTGAAIATRMFPAAGPGGTVFLRLGCSAVMLLAVARPRLRSAPRADLLTAASFGVVLAAMNATFYLALNRVPLGVGVTVEFLGPLGVAVAGSRRVLDVLWVVLAAAGVALLAGGGGHVDEVGLGLAAVAGGFWAAYIVLSQRVGRVLPGAAGLTIALVVGAVLTAPYGVVDGGQALLRPGVLGRGVAVAALSSAVPYSLELAALRRLKASVFGILMSLEPAMGALSGLGFLGQHLRLPDWVAIGCVVTASVGATTRRAPTTPDELPAQPLDEVVV